MEIALDPTVLDLAKEKTGCTSDDQLGQKFLDKSGTAVRNWRKGKSVPDIKVCMILPRITHRPIEDMFSTPSQIAAA